MQFEKNELFFSSTAVTNSTNGAAYDLTRYQNYHVQVNYTVNTPANQVFASTAVNTGTSQVTITSHGFATGLAVTLTTTGTLPTGLSLATTYYLIVIDANTVQFASNLANALAGTAITLSAQGSGNDTVVVTALAGGNVKIQSSCDKVNWQDIPSSTQAVTVTGSVQWPGSFANFPYMRLVTAITSGQLNIQAYFCTKTGY
jgi:hypothetical protein